MRNLILILSWLFLGAWTDAGFNFRATSGYVSDGADQTYVLADTYPTTRGGFTFGWTSALGDGSRDRDSGIDVRLAGQNQVITPNAPRTFRVDLSATGSYTICVANGDATSTQSDQRLEFYDDSTLLFSIVDAGGSSIAGGNFNDASGVERTAAAWPGSQVCVTHTFATTIFNMVAGSGSSENGTIAHLRIYAAAASSNVLFLNASGEQ